MFDGYLSLPEGSLKAAKQIWGPKQLSTTEDHLAFIALIHLGSLPVLLQNTPTQNEMLLLVAEKSGEKLWRIQTKLASPENHRI